MLIISADLSIAHLPDESVQQSLKTLEIDPNFAVGHYTLGQAYEQKDMHELAIGEFEKAIELGGHDDAFDSNLAYVNAVSGRRQQAQSILTDLQMRKELNPAAQANIALIYAGLGEPDQAILLRPAFDSLRSDTRFEALRLRIGLPGR